MKLAVIIAFLSSGLTYGQNTIDCLSPIGQPLLGGLKKYEEEINRRVLSNFSDFQLIRYQQGEFAWVIEQEGYKMEKVDYKISWAYPSISIWSAIPDQESKEIKIISGSKRIDESDVKILEELFDSALSTVCAKCHNIGIDGMYFYFSNFSITGKVWRGSKNHTLKKERLVSICEEIASQLIISKKPRYKLAPDTQAQIKRLTLDFEESQKD